jgi:hypothetical protein
MKPEYGAERVPLDYLRDLTESAQRKYPVGSTWRHYKGKEFVVTGFTTGEHMNQIFVRFAYPEDVVKIIPDALHDKWGLPMPAAISEHDFSIEINLWEEQLETENFAGPRFTKIAA